MMVSTLLVMVLAFCSISGAFASEEEFYDLRKLMNEFQEKTGCELHLKIDEHSHLVIGFTREVQAGIAHSYYRVLTNEDLYCNTANAIFYLNPNVIHELVEKYTSGETNLICNGDNIVHPTFYGDDNDNYFVKYAEFKQSFDDVTGAELGVYIFEPSGFISFGFHSRDGYECRIIGHNEYLLLDSNVFYLDPIVYFDLMRLYTEHHS